MEKEVIEGLIGQYGWMLIAGFLFLIGRQTIESTIEAIKVFAGDDLVAIQNDKLKSHLIEKPLPMLDLKKWDDCKENK